MILLIIQLLLGIAFVLSGIAKFAAKQMADEFVRYGYSSGFRKLTGALEILGAAGMIAGIWVTLPDLTLYAAILLVIIMVGAIYTHIFKVKDPIGKSIAPLVLLILSTIVLLDRLIQ
jgi:putative oxidoreductase